MVKGYWLAVKEAFLPIEPSKYYFHRGGAKVSPRWKKDATAVEGWRHRGGGNFCSYAPGNTHNNFFRLEYLAFFSWLTCLSHAEYFILRRAAEDTESASLMLAAFNFSKI